MKTLLPAVFLFVAIPQAVPAAETESSPAEATRFDLHFHGGSLEQMLVAIAEASGVPPNAVIGGEARTIELPPFHLKSVTEGEVFEALSQMPRLPVNGDIRISQAGRDGIYLLDGFVRPSPPTLRTQVFHVGTLLADLQVEDLASAIKMAWEMEGTKEEGELRFHEGTELLLVRGNMRQIDLVQQMLTALTDHSSTQAQANAAETEAKRSEELAKEIRRRRQIREQLMKEHENP